MSLEETKEGSSYTDSQDLQDAEVETESKTSSDVSLNSQNNDIEEGRYKQSEEEQELYDKILEKLDIKKNEQAQDDCKKNVDEKRSQETYLNKVEKLKEYQVKSQIEQALKQDFDKIQKLVQSGLINSGQGQNLKKQVLKKAFDKLVQTEKVKRNLLPASEEKKQTKVIDKTTIFEEFSKNNPDFFDSEGRKEVLDYLKSDKVNVGKDELNRISEIIRLVEKSAIDRYLQKTAHEKTLKDSNESAKQKLRANAQKSSLGGGLSRTFTREQIGKMSTSEFAKYEKAIMDALKKGQIR